ncbi:unnamed protein product [Mytilus coruscus]|uniref:Uncharacterized protein n=1 Tax=Mytilus coruscus TaxID=42192 RepID=A0A6J8AEP8_MYTCO|nr:unnamed protein product [Mytilus coruscus]
MEDIDITGTDEKVDIRREQLRDPIIRYWIDNVMKKSPRKEDIPAVPFHRLLLSNFNRLILKDGILFRRTTVDGESKDQKETTPVPKPRTTRREPLTKDPQPPASISSNDDSESEDESFMILIPQHTDDTDISTNSDDDDKSEEPVAEVHESQTDGDQQGVIGQEETGDTEDAPSSDETEDPVPEQTEEAAATADVEVEEAVSSDEPGKENDEDEIPNIPRRSVRTKTSTATTRYKDFVCKQTQPKTDWLMRAQFLKDAVSSGVFRGSEDRVKDALLRIVTDTD